MNKTHGMTLLEVLIALAVFGLAALAVMKSTGEQVRGLTYLQQKNLALWVADNQLARVLAQQPWPEEGWHFGESDMADMTWYWRWQSIQTTDEKIRAIEINVSHLPDVASPLSSLRTYVVKP